MGTLTQAGKTFNVTIRINDFSSPEERQVLVDAFNKAGFHGLYNALEKMESKFAARKGGLRHKFFTK